LSKEDLATYLAYEDEICTAEKVLASIPTDGTAAEA